MTQSILSVAALLIGSGFLLFAGGVNALILPVRGAAEGFSSLSLGLLGTSWACGYVLGCLFVPRLVVRVGHIRSFSVMASLAGLAILASLLFVSPFTWIGLRAISGFCFAGAAMIVEGWLGERSDVSTRGRIFGVYTMINLFATTAGQMILTTGDPKGHTFFVVAAMFYILAVIPPAVTSSASPTPLVETRVDIAALYRNSPVAVVSSFMVGIANGAFGTLAAVYAKGIGFDLTTIALFASLPILAGAAAQIPIGIASDRIDRRIVLTVVALVAALADLAFIFNRPDESAVALVAAVILGAAIFTMYPIILAHANDHAPPASTILTSGGLLMVFGLGAIFGPLVAGFAMDFVGMHGLFMTTATAHIAIVAHSLWRVGQRAGVPDDEKAAFMVTPLARTMTPQTAVLAQQSELTDTETETETETEPESALQSDPDDKSEPTDDEPGPNEPSR